MSAMLAVVLVGAAMAPATPVFPGAAWESRSPESVGLDPAALDALAETLGGRGCIVRDGYVVRAWGDQAERGDWMSAAKPVLSTLLFVAIDEGRVASVDQPIADFGWPLEGKDRGITFRHLGAMTSGYARPEGPGQAWAYNDFAIQLYQKTLFEKVFSAPPADVAQACLGPLGFEDGLRFRDDKPRLYASVRDFARIAWFWLNRFQWDGHAVLPEATYTAYVKPQTPKNLPQTEKAETHDYLGIGSYGGGSDHFTACGPGVYGFNWWFNETGRAHPDARLWPDAPTDTYMAIGAGGNCAAMFPSLGMVLVAAEADWGKLEPGQRDSRMNTVLARAARAAGSPPPGAAVSGELKAWHRVTLSFAGPDTAEQAAPNPFTDCRLDVTFTQGERAFTVPGYYAADGNAGETGADTGNVWRAHFMPNAPGEWHYVARFRTGPGVALSTDADAGVPTAFDGARGSFRVAPTDKVPPDARGNGLLRHVGQRYLQYAESGTYYLKGGADSPENFLAFADFDATRPTKTWAPHAGDWQPGDPSWRGGKGKNIIGALNYLGGKGMNVVYFLTMNVKGDGKDVWPWTHESERYRFDCSKLDQWEIVFTHMDRLGIVLHVVLQEQENDQLLDGGELGPERRLYFRELIARFAHHPALVWNLGEENTNTPAQRRAFAEYFATHDPYGHPVVLHTFPSQRGEVYTDLLGYPHIHGPSLQLGDMTEAYGETRKWVQASADAGHPWFVCLDEIGPANVGAKPDAADPEHNEVRVHALWGNLMAGGSGTEWLFGYGFPHNDVTCEDWRSRDILWDQTRHALTFFQDHIPFAEMVPRDDVVKSGEAWCLGGGGVYALFLPTGGTIRINLPAGRYRVAWYNPRTGGSLIQGDAVDGPGDVSLGPPPAEPGRDWAVRISSE